MEDVIDPSTTPPEKHKHTGDPMVDDPYLRSLGYAGRIGRLVGPALTKGTRYLAYTSDVGEAFRPVVSLSVVRAGYAISWGYVATDVALNVKWAREANKDYMRAGLHAAVFQSFGSMIFPAIIIHTVVHQTDKHLFKPRFPQYQKWGPTGMGLAVVPFLPFICDHPVEMVTDYAFDRFWPTTTSNTGENEKKKH